jgi:hypothetical protein
MFCVRLTGELGGLRRDGFPSVRPHKFLGTDSDRIGALGQTVKEERDCRRILLGSQEAEDGLEPGLALISALPFQVSHSAVGSEFLPELLQCRISLALGFVSEPRHGEEDVIALRAFEPGVLRVLPLFPGIASDGLRDVTEQLLDVHPAIPVAVRLPLQAPKQVVGEQSVLELGRFNRLLTFIARRDEESIRTRQLLECRRLDGHIARRRARYHVVAPQHMARMAAIQNNDHGLGSESFNELADLSHAHASRHEIVWIGIIRKQVALFT